MRVLIKTWEQMKREYGVGSTGNICYTFSFTHSMENHIPINRIIFVYNNMGILTWKRLGHRSSISEDMIEKILVE